MINISNKGIYFYALFFAVISLTNSLPAHIHKTPITVAANYQIYAGLYFGSQGKQIDLLLDTGSRTLATFCDLCKNGCIQEQEYLTVESKAFKEIKCNNVEEFNNVSPALKRCSRSCLANVGSNSTCTGDLAYGSSDLSSYLDYYLIYDEIRIHKNSHPAFSSFGCIYDEKDFFSGIWGLALDADNEFLDSVYNNDISQGLTDAKKLFSICLQGHKGVLFIGGVDESIHIGQGFKIRALEQYGLWWNLDPRDIGLIKYGEMILHNRQESFGRDNIILDSGTDVNVLPSILVKKIQSQVQKLCQSMPNNCIKTDAYDVFKHTYIITDAQSFFAGSLKITIQISGRFLETPLSNYFWNLGSNKWALALISRQEFHFGMSILGSIFMNNFDIQFNRELKQITIYDISTCEHRARLLQSQSSDQVDPDEYILPHERENVDPSQHIQSIKVKYQKSYQQLSKSSQFGI